MTDDIARTNMLKQQLRTWHVLDQNILDLIASVPREQFVPKGYERLAFSEARIDLGEGRSMLTPGEEGRILQALDVQPTDRVLLIGIDGGFLMTCLAKQALQVYAVERDASLKAHAQESIQQVKLSNVTLLDGDIYSGWEKDAPFDVIVISGSMSEVPTSVQDSLAPGGRLFAIVGSGVSMSATLMRHLDTSTWETTHLFETTRARTTNFKEPSGFTF